MIAVDTNVLIRYLVEDDPYQSRKAEQVFITAEEKGESLFISEIVLVETVWVLKRCYRLKREDIAEILVRLVHARQLSFDKALLKTPGFTEP